MITITQHPDPKVSENTVVKAVKSLKNLTYGRLICFELPQQALTHFDGFCGPG